jgi:hypothetical protein
LRIFRKPILARQAIHGGKLTKIFRNNYEAAATGVGRNHQIIQADHHASRLKVGAIPTLELDPKRL